MLVRASMRIQWKWVVFLELLRGCLLLYVFIVSLNFGQDIFLIIQLHNFWLLKSKLRGRKACILLGNLCFYYWSVYLKVWLLCAFISKWQCVLRSHRVNYCIAWLAGCFPTTMIGCPCWFFWGGGNQNECLWVCLSLFKLKYSWSTMSC